MRFLSHSLLSQYFMKYVSPESSFLSRSKLKVSFVTGKATGFGGTLDNNSKQTQDVSCGLKEALIEVLLYRICLFLMRSYQVAPCEELSGKNYNFDAAFGQLLCDANKPPKRRIFVNAESDALPDASSCFGDSGGPLVF